MQDVLPWVGHNFSTWRRCYTSACGSSNSHGPVSQHATNPHYFFGCFFSFFCVVLFFDFFLCGWTRKSQYPRFNGAHPSDMQRFSRSHHVLRPCCFCSSGHYGHGYFSAVLVSGSTACPLSASVLLLAVSPPSPPPQTFNSTVLVLYFFYLLWHPLFYLCAQTNVFCPQDALPVLVSGWSFWSRHDVL